MRSARGTGRSVGGARERPSVALRAAAGVALVALAASASVACRKREHAPAAGDAGVDSGAFSSWSEPAEALPTAAPTPVAEGRTRYVAASGSDRFEGTLERPFRTVQRALEDVEPGTAIVLRGGASKERPVAFAGPARIRQPRVTLRSYPGEWAAIRCPVNDEENAAICVEFDVDASDGKLERLEVSGGFYYGVSFETKWDWGDPNDRGGASRVTLEDCVIHDTGRDAVKIKPSCDDITIRRCEIHHSGVGYPPGTPQEDKNAEGIDNVNGDRMVVQDSYVHDTASTGIYFKGGATDCVVERTRVERAGEAGVLVGFDTSVEFFDLKENPGYSEAIRGVVRNVVVADTGYEGIGLYGSRDTLVANNTVVRAARKGHAPLYFGVTLQDFDRDAKRPANVRPTIVNNVFAQPAGRAAPCVAIRHSAELGGLAGLAGPVVMNRNVYFREGAPCTFQDGRPASPLEAGTLEAWQKHLRAEAQSATFDPRLDPAQRLLPESPCRKRGEALGAVRYDIDRQLRAAPFDLGADELP
jgi:hypothetical protein